MTTKKGLDLLKDPTLKEQYPQKLHLARYPKHAYVDPNEVLPVPDDAWPRQWQAELPARHPGEDLETFALELPEDNGEVF